MRAFIDMTPVSRGFMMTAELILCFLALYCIITAIIYKIPFRITIWYILLFAADYFLLQPMYVIAANKEVNSLPSGFFLAFGKLPGLLIILIMAILFTATLFSIFKVRKRQHMYLSPISIKESTDNLPTGLCFCNETGMPLLVNPIMQKLCSEVTGSTMLDANHFWETLCSKSAQKDIPNISSESDIIVKMSDKSVWLFSRKALTADNAQVYEITASEITDMHNLGLKLKEKIKNLQIMNERMKKYNDMVQNLAREEEILDAKIAIHDKLGRALITTRRYLESEENESNNEINELWKHSIYLLQQESKAEIFINPIYEIKKAAELFGVKITLNGMFPQDDKEILKLIKEATMESLNNAVRHAGATELIVNAESTKTFSSFEFTNNGQIPDKPVTEGGGLSALRSRVESMFGEVLIETQPYYCLTITIPKKREFLYD